MGVEWTNLATNTELREPSQFFLFAFGIDAVLCQSERRNLTTGTVEFSPFPVVAFLTHFCVLI
jgi:hypothetical protein